MQNTGKNQDGKQQNQRSPMSQAGQAGANEQAEQTGQTEQAGQSGQSRQADASNTVNASRQQDEGAQEKESMSQLQQKLQEEQRRAEEYLDLLRRTQADFINYRRRVTQEQDESRANAQIQVLQAILPVIDDLDRALAVVPQELSGNPWVQGILLASHRIDATLERLGVREIGKPGEHFDPHWMEAMASEAKPGVPEGTILTVIRPGFALGERIIRPAQVIVATGSEATSPTGAAPGQSRNTGAD